MSMPRRVLLHLVVPAVLLAACGGGGGSASTSVAPSTTTTSLVAPLVCEADDLLAVVKSATSAAGLAVGGEWSDDTVGAAFDDRTDTSIEFARLLALDCGVRLVQRTDEGAERLLLAAWTGDRHGFVLQATDTPVTPFATGARFELLLEQPYGEFLEDQRLWAATLSGGESILLGANDYSIAVTAKSWQSEFPPWDDLPVTLESERYGIDRIISAGGRNVSVAEPAPVGSEIGSIQFHSPLGLSLIASVAPVGLLDPMVPYSSGDSTFDEVNGVTVRVTRRGDSDPSWALVADAGWTCDGHTWRISSNWGTPEELADAAAAIVRTGPC